MTPLEQLLLNNLKRAAQPQPQPQPVAATAPAPAAAPSTIPSPPPGFTMDAPAAAPVAPAASAIPAPPPGFTMDAAAPSAIPAPPPGFTVDGVPPVDNSSAMGDLQAGLLGLQNAGTMGGILMDTARANMNDAYGQLPDQFVANLDAEIADFDARIAASTDEVERLMLQEGRDRLVSERAGYQQIGADPKFQAQGQAGDALAADLRTRIFTERVPEMMGRNAEMAAIPTAPSAQEFFNADGFMDSLATLWNSDDKSGILRTIALRSIPQSLPSVGAGIAGGIAAGPGGAAAGAGAAGGLTEALSYQSQKLGEALQAQGVDVSNPDAVRAFFEQNKDQLGQIYADGFKRGGIVGAFDALSGGIISNLATAPIRGAGRAARVSRVAAGAGAEAGTEMAGEATAQVAVDGKINAPEVLAEGIGGAVIGAPATAIQMGAEALKGNTAPPPAAPPAEPIQPPSEPIQPQPPEPAPGPTPTPPEGGDGGDDTGFEPLDPEPTPTPPAEPDPADVQPIQTPVEPFARIPDEENAGPEGMGAKPRSRSDFDEIAAGDPTLGDTPINLDVQTRAEQTTALDGMERRLSRRRREINTALEEMQRKSLLGRRTDAEREEYNRLANELGRTRELENVVRAVNRDTYSYALDKGGPTFSPSLPAYQRDLVTRMQAAVGGDLPVDVFHVDDLSYNHPVVKGSIQGKQAYEAITKESAHGVMHFIPRRDQYGSLEMTSDGRSTGRFIIVMNRNSTGNNLHSAETLAHEVGHMIQFGMFDALPLRDKLDVMSAYAEWRRTTKKPFRWISRKGVGGQKQMARALRRPFDQAEITWNDDYANRFAEWWADQTARHFTTNQVGQTTLERFFAKVAAMWKRLAAGLRAGGYVSKEIEAFFKDAVLTGAQNNLFDGKVMPTSTPQMLEDGAGPEGFDRERIEDQLRNPLVDPNEEDLADPVSADVDVDASAAPTDQAQAKPEQAQAKPEQAQAKPATLEDQGGVRVPRGGFTPNMRRVSFAEAGPISEAAFRDAGLEPDEAINLPPVQQRNILVRLMKDRFGIEVEVKGDLNLREGIDQLLDAYRGMRAMSAVLHLHPTAMSLGGRLRITFEKFKGRYLGAYAPATTTIHMPGRSNSFAHEWGHALDHFLRDMIPTASQSFETLLSQVTRQEGLNPKDRLQGAFINLIHRMFFDEAALAAKMLELEQDATKTDKQGKPTKAAQDAALKLEKLRAGATRIKIDPTAYREDSIAFSPRQSGYYGSVHEMLARAFEAYVAHQLNQAGVVKQNFVTKGDDAYLSDADARLRMTFPKLSERVAIFKAFDDLFDAIRAGSLGAAGAPENFADADIVDPAKWQKLYLAQTKPDAGLLGDLKKEFAAMRNALAEPVKAMRATVSGTALGLGLNQNTPGNLKALGRAALWVVNSQRGIVKSMIARQPEAVQKHLRYLAGQVMTDPGTGSVYQQGENYEEQVERSATRTGSVIDKLLRANNLTRGAIKGALDKDVNDRVRQIMLDGDAAGATAQEKTVASGLRRLIDDAYRYGLKAGLDMGYVRDKGYLPRILLADRVEADGAKFVTQAQKVYRIHYDRFMATMQDKDLSDFAAGLSNKWKSRRNIVRPAPFDAEAAAFNKAARDLRAAERALERAMAEAQKNPGDRAKQAAVTRARAERDQAKAVYDQARADAVAAMREPYAEISAEAWRENIEAGDGMQFDTLGPAQNYNAKRVLPSEADDLLADFYETDVIQLTMNYVHGVTRQAAYRTRLGVVGESDNAPYDVKMIVLRDEVQAAVRQNPRKYNVETADGQFNIIKDLADPTRDNIKEMMLRSAEQFGASSEALGQMRDTIESITGRVSRGKTSRNLDAVVSAVYAMGTIVALPRAMWTMLTEPLAFMLKTGDVKGSARVMRTYLREAVRSAKDVQELEALAEMVGVVASPLHDALMLNRIADGATVDSTSALLSRFFRANWMAQLTNAQRRSVLAGATYMFRDMAAKWNKADANTPKGRADRKIIEADLRDLGVSDEQMEGFVQWLASGTGLPSLDDLQTPEGKVYTAAAARFVDTTIMNPRRADKPPLSLSPYGRLVFGLTSFIYAFTRNVHYATALRTGRNMDIRRGEGMAALTGTDAFNDVGARMLGGFGLILAGQMIVGAVRAFLFDHDQWEKKLEEDEEDDDALYWWLGKLALSRTGVLGGLDVIQQSVTGLRYERDLTSLTSGAYPSIFLGSIQKMAGVLSDRNSANTETAENQAVKAAYQFFLAPTASALLSAVPVAGPATSFARNAALQYTTSNNAAQSFADQFFTKGEKK